MIWVLQSRGGVVELLAGHLLGDILFQNRYIARIKMESILGMCLHCLLYTIGVWIFSTFSFLQLVAVFLSHFIIDYFGIGKKVYPNFIKMGNPKNEKEPVPMWLSILVDQSFHLIFLVVISKCVF